LYNRFVQLFLSYFAVRLSSGEDVFPEWHGKTLKETVTKAGDIADEIFDQTLANEVGGAMRPAPINGLTFIYAGNA
jgi:hypothetical protein